MNLQRKQNKPAGPTSHKESSKDRLMPLVIFAVLLSVTLLIPWPMVKIAGFFAVVISLTFFNTISRTLGAILLGFFFALAYLFSPYWLYITTIKDNAVIQTIGTKPTMIITLILLILTGLVWSYLAAGNVPVGVRQAGQKSFIRRILPLAALALLVMVCNYGPLCNNISVLGDESYHITRIRFLHTFLSWFFIAAKTIILPATGLFSVIILFSLWKRLSAETTIGISLAGLLAIYLGVVAYHRPDYVGRLDMLRYPFLSSWFGNLGPIWRVNPHDERLFRVLPLLSAFGIAVFGWWAARKQNVTLIAAFIFAFALALTPTIYYYSTTLYLELPSVALLFIALYFIEPIVAGDFKSVRSSPGWYALMAAGFIKENIASFIAGIIVLRIFVRAITICKTKDINIRAILNEAAAVFCIAAPLGVFIFLMYAFQSYNMRPYLFAYNNIADITLWSAAFKSLWSQFAVLLPIAIAGLVISIIRRRFVFAFSIMFLFVFDFLFHFLERANCIGYARYNLFLFSIFAVPAIVALGWLAEKNRLATIAISLILLLTNVVLSPVAITGEKDPAWGATLSKDITDYYFPLEDTVKWLKANYPKSPVYIGGAYGDSNILWYFDKLGYHPPFVQVTISQDTPPLEALTAAAAQAQKLGAPLLIWHKMQGGPQLTEQEKAVLNYKAIKIFNNRNLAIVVYENQRGK
ncbi:MAG: hypothetical protein JW947_05010 [Sedimentisphaerales bacterium]|nr:hypothetical protein [Sedimentisphaerales bacterium]